MVDQGFHGLLLDTYRVARQDAARPVDGEQRERGHVFTPFAQWRNRQSRTGETARQRGFERATPSQLAQRCAGRRYHSGSNGSRAFAIARCPDLRRQRFGEARLRRLGQGRQVAQEQRPTRRGLKPTGVALAIGAEQ